MDLDPYRRLDHHPIDIRNHPNLAGYQEQSIQEADPIKPKTVFEKENQVDISITYCAQ
jgi:hypothetical protein